LIVEIAIDPIITISASILFAALLVLFALFASVAHDAVLDFIMAAFY
jgi:hypothetical protein